MESGAAAADDRDLTTGESPRAWPRKSPQAKRVAGVFAFFQHEAAGGIVLLVVRGRALVLANSRAEHIYDALLETPLMLTVDGIQIGKPLLHWINDGLMALSSFSSGSRSSASCGRGTAEPGAGGPPGSAAEAAWRCRR